MTVGPPLCRAWGGALQQWATPSMACTMVDADGGGMDAYNNATSFPHFSYDDLIRIRQLVAVAPNDPENVASDLFLEFGLPLSAAILISQRPRPLELQEFAFLRGQLESRSGSASRRSARDMASGSHVTSP